MHYGLISERQMKTSYKEQVIEKKAESAGALNAHIYLIMDAQLNIQNGTYVSAVY